MLNPNVSCFNHHVPMVSPIHGHLQPSPPFSHVFFPMDPRARPVVQVPPLMAEVDGNPQGQPAPCWPGAEGDLCNGHGTKKVVNRYAEDDFSFFFPNRKVTSWGICDMFYLLGVPQANPGYSMLLVTSLWPQCLRQQEPELWNVPCSKLGYNALF